MRPGARLTHGRYASVQHRTATPSNVAMSQSPARIFTANGQHSRDHTRGAAVRPTPTCRGMPLASRKRELLDKAVHVELGSNFMRWIGAFARYVCVGQ